MIGRDAFLDRRLVVVGALHQRFTGDVILAGNARRVEIDMVRASRCRMHAAAAHALENFVIGDFDVNHDIDVDIGLAQRLDLRQRAWKTVHDETGDAVRRLDAFLDQSDDQRVRHQCAALHERAGFVAER